MGATITRLPLNSLTLVDKTHRTWLSMSKSGLSSILVITNYGMKMVCAFLMTYDATIPRTENFPSINLFSYIPSFLTRIQEVGRWVVCNTLVQPFSYRKVI